MRSEQINDLALALSKAQAEIHGAVKDSNNLFFESNYADLASTWGACREALTKNHLSIIQTTEITPSGPILVTTLFHGSGQFIQGHYPIRPQKEGPQALGSAVTYARRYALAAMVGVCPVDDDGEAAMNRNRSGPSISSAAPDDVPPFPFEVMDAEIYEPYRIPFGKFKDQKLSDFKGTSLADYAATLEHLLKQPDSDIGPKLKEQFNTFLDQVDLFSRLNKKT